MKEHITSEKIKNYFLPKSYYKFGYLKNIEEKVFYYDYLQNFIMSNVPREDKSEFMAIVDENKRKI